MQYIVASERNAPYILQYSPLTHHIYCNVCFREQYIGILHILQYIVNILYIAYTVPHPWLMLMNVFLAVSTSSSTKCYTTIILYISILDIRVDLLLQAKSKSKRYNSIFYPFFHSFSHTWRGAGNKKNSRHRTKGTEIEDNG